VTLKSDGMSGGIVLLALLCAFSFGAIVKVALADSYHVTCVGHGFDAGSSQTDGSFFARVEPGCSGTNKQCSLYTNGVLIGYSTIYGASGYCNTWSRNFGNYSECNSTAHVYYQGVFSDHVHTAPNWCG
jgi:hypothetical protein